MVRSSDRGRRALGRAVRPQPCGGNPRRTRRRRRQLARQAIASALCAASLLAGQLLSGAEPAAPGFEPKIWSAPLRAVDEPAASRFPEARTPLPPSIAAAPETGAFSAPRTPTPHVVVNRTLPGVSQPQLIHNHTLPSGQGQLIENPTLAGRSAPPSAVYPQQNPPPQYYQAQAQPQPLMIENYMIQRPGRPQVIENTTMRPPAGRWPVAEQLPPRPRTAPQLTPQYRPQSRAELAPVVEPEVALESAIEEAPVDVPEEESPEPATPEPARLVEATPLPVDGPEPTLEPIPAAPPRLAPLPLNRPQPIASPTSKQTTLPPVVPASAMPQRPAKFLGVGSWLSKPRPIAAVSDDATSSQVARKGAPQTVPTAAPASWIQDIQQALDRDGTGGAELDNTTPAAIPEPGVRNLRRHGQAASRPVRPAQYSHVDDGDLFAAEASQPAPRPPRAAAGQPATLEPLPPANPLPPGSPFEAITESGTLTIRVRRSLLMRTKMDIYRTAVVDDSICDVVQFTPREISLIGKSQGSTHVTFWFAGDDQPPLTYLVKVEPDVDAVKQDEVKYQLLEDLINEMFPDSKVSLAVLADKLLVRGQARDSEEAAQILAIIRTQGQTPPGGGLPPGGTLLGVADAAATGVLPFSATGTQGQPTYQIVNMLRVPGVQQVALRVKIAELNRSAARGFGVNVETDIDFSDAVNGSRLLLASLLNTPAGGGASVIADISGDDASLGIRYLQQRGVIRLLSEPTLVTLSGKPATFVAGGEFAVPTVVGAVGLNAVTTDFRAFGAIISFLPTVVDKDRIRLQVAPEFSQINSDLTVNNTPGLNIRAATTTVEMREGQTLAIAGLLEDNYTASSIGDVPLLAKIFGRRNAAHNETELIILVTPELVHPLEPEEVPPLPGFDVTEPTNKEFFLGGHLEGHPSRAYRSTVWPRLKRRYGGPAMTSGPFGHGE